MNTKAEKAQFENIAKTADQISQGLGRILDIQLTVQVVLAGTRMPIADILQLAQGSVVELEKLADEPLDVLVNGKLVARGEAVIINDKLGVRILEVVSAPNRLSSLKEESPGVASIVR